MIKTTLADGEVDIQVTFKHDIEYIINRRRNGSVSWEGPRFVTYCFGELNGRPFLGKAVCHPNDVYDRKLGRKKAFAEFVKDATKVREYRAMLWQTYFDAANVPIVTG